MIDRLEEHDVLHMLFNYHGVSPSFVPEEFLNTQCSPVPTPLLAHIIPTAIILTEARKRFGAIVVNSGYRDVAYNARVGGSPNSQHTHFTAADVRPLHASVSELHHWLLSHRFTTRLGIGIYDTFVHVDCRHWPGMPGVSSHPARWDLRTPNR
jgi:uncharacterized protein YcbK (DUF882 family)